MNARRAAVFAASAALAAAAAWAVSRPETFWFDGPEEALAKAEGRFYRDLLASEGLFALWTFDGRDAGGWFADSAPARAAALASGGADPAAPAFPGTLLVAGRHGGARRFSGDGGCFGVSGREWRHGPSRPLSVALWAKLEPRPARQDLLCTGDSGRWGLCADGDRIAFDYRTPEGVRRIVAPFARNGKWTHLAVVADPRPDGGAVRLYVDGTLRAEEPLAALAPFRWPLAFGAFSALRVRDALRGDLDDAAVWDRALSADEVRRLASSPRSLAETLAAPRASARLARARRRAAFRAAAGRVFAPVAARLRSAPPPPPGAGAAAPAAETVSLRVGKGGLRRLWRAHERARRSGCVPDGSARPVSGFLTAGGRTVRCLVSVHGGVAFYPDSPRPCFAVVPAEPGGALPGGARRLVLSPPESCGGLFPLAGALAAGETGLPLAPGCRAVSLRVEGRERGLYLARDFSRMGAAVVPGKGAASSWTPNGNAARAVRAERALLAPGAFPPGVAAAARAFLGPEARAAVAARLRAAEAAFARDRFSPLPPGRRARLLAAAGDAWEALPPGPPEAAEAPLDAALFAGANLSPSRVVSDLPLARLAAAAAPGAELRFRSLAPDLLDDEGRVVGRPARAPADAPVEAVWRGPDGSERTGTLLFRVMPERLALPTLALWTGSRLGKLRPKDAVAEWFEPGAAADGPARVLLATAAGGGGIRFRGNSSFDSPRRPFAVRTDGPCGAFGADSPGRRFVVAGGSSDPTLVCNALASDLFRSFPRADGRTNPVPRVRRAEVYLDGRYEGVRECVERVDRDLPGCAGSTFFRHAVAEPFEPFLRPSHAPSRRAEDAALAALRDAEALAAGPDGPDWHARVAARFDLDSAADFFLLSDLLGNGNGYPKHFDFDEIMRFDPASGRFGWIPWDFDKSLRESVRRIGTDFDRLLAASFPGWKERLAARWRELRAGPCSDEALLARFDALWAETDGWLVFNERLRQPGREDHAADLEGLRSKFREILLARAARLDGAHGRAAGGD